jgi:hypothetical protein
MSPAPELPPLHVLSLDPAIGWQARDDEPLAETIEQLIDSNAAQAFPHRPDVDVDNLALWRAFAGMRTLRASPSVAGSQRMQPPIDWAGGPNRLFEIRFRNPMP